MENVKMNWLMRGNWFDLAIATGVKIGFLNLGFKGYRAFNTICNEYDIFFKWELYLFWEYNTYSESTLNKINRVLEQLKAE